MKPPADTVVEPVASSDTLPSGQATGRAPTVAELGGWTRYRIEALVGEGAVGAVYRAWDPRLERAVAVKILRGADAEAARRFDREARAQARLRHEHVCEIYEVGEAPGGRPYIAMQLVDGQT